MYLLLTYVLKWKNGYTKVCRGKRGYSFTAEKYALLKVETRNGGIETLPDRKRFLFFRRSSSLEDSMRPSPGG